jgi:hypothetical protein
MKKISTKKMLTVLISLAMVFSALAVISMAAQPAYATASGTITLNPTTFGESGGIPVATLVTANGGTFGSGTTVYFYLSSTASSSGIASTGYYSGPIGSVLLPGGSTTLSNTVVTIFKSPNVVGAITTLTYGSYYILASDTSFSGGIIPSGAQFTTAVPINVVSTQPTVSIASTVTVGSSQLVTGSSFDAGASITLYLNYPGSSTVLGTTTTGASGSFSTYVTIPALAQGTYEVVAEETNTLSATFTVGGITADTSTAVEPSITVSPISTNGAAGSVFTITGSGFGAGDSIIASTTSSPTSSITIGGVNTYHSAVTVATDGSFTVSVTLSAAIANTVSAGPVNVVITGLSSSSPNTFTDAVYVSVPNPTILGFSFSATPLVPGGAATAAVWNFPAGTAVSIYLGPVLVGSITTDSNGYGALSAPVPAMPAGIYKAYAETSSGLFATPVSVTITSYFNVTDPTGALMKTSAAEYMPSDGIYNVSAYGLLPTDTFTLTDKGASTSASVVSVSVGSYSASSGLFSPASNGTLIFHYTPVYAAVASPPATGTSEAITLTGTSSGPVPGYPSGASAYGYYTIGAVTIVSPAYLSNNGAGTGAQSFSASTLIPSTATLYPGVNNEYNVYIGTTELTISGSTVVPASGTGTASGSFTNPVLSSGVYNLSIVYNGQPVSKAVFTEPVIISTSASSLQSGSIVLEPNSAGGSIYDIVGYGFDQSASIVAYYMTSSGLKTPTMGTVTHGAFVTTTSIPIPLSDVSGTYSVFATATLGSSTYTAYTSYTVTPSLSISSPSPASGPVGTSIAASATGLEANAYYDVYFAGMYQTTLPATSSGAISSISVTVPTVAAGTYNLTLDPSGTTTAVASAAFAVTANSDLTLGTMSQDAFPGQLVQFTVNVGSTLSPTLPSGAVGTGYFASISLNGTLYQNVTASYKPSTKDLTGSFQMPNNLAGSYYLLTITGYETYTYTQAVTTSQQLPLSATGTTDFTSTTAATITVAFTDPSYGSLSTVSLTATGNYELGTSPYYAVVTAYSPDTSTSGSITYSIATIGALTATYADTITSSPVTNAVTAAAPTTSGHAPINGTYVTYTPATIQFSGQSHFTTSQSDFFGLAQGNGALLTGISSGQIATITADVTNAVTTSMKVPLSELNASVVAINGAVAKINTAFGNMTATLKSINATVQSISSGQVLVLTKLGSVETSLASLNASLMMVSGNVATINTTLGMVQTSLSSIGTTVSSTATSVSGLVGSTATIKTDLGNISGQVTGVSNGVATIQTSIGKLNSTVSQIQLSAGQIKSGSNTLEIFLVVAIVLILITLVIAFLAVNNTNRLAKKFEEQKKQ